MHVPCRSELGIEARVPDNRITVEIDNKGYVYQVNKEALSIFKHVFEYARRIYKLQDLEFLKDITLNKKSKRMMRLKTSVINILS